jgi:hypothetical protein
MIGFCNLFSDFIERDAKRANEIADQVMKRIRAAVDLR